MAGRVAYYGGIVKDGLVLNLDAAKKDSYGGTGTTWSDISGNQRNATLTSPTFTTEGGGGFTAGTINYPVATRLYPTQLTLEVTLRIVTTIIFTQYVDYGQIGSVSAGKLWFRGTNSGNGVQVIVTGNTTTGTQSVLGNTTHGVSTTKIITVTLSNTGVALVYSNGVQVQSGTVTNFVSWQIETTAGRIVTGNYVSNLKIYNRALTAQEVLQNYNAVKSRYGL
jgi:hypothetical protein